MACDCDIVIPVHDQLNYTRECLESIGKHTSSPHRIIVVNDASGRDTGNYLNGLQRAGRIVLLENKENLGWLKSANRGLRFAGAEYVCLMNNDTVAAPGWLEEMISVAGKEERIGLVNPCWEVPGRHSPKTRSRQRFHGRYVETDWARGFCVLMKRAVIRQVGDLDEELSPGYFDDHDFSIRAIRAGFICVRAQGAFVGHYGNATFREKLRDGEFHRLFERNRKIFYRKWGRPLRILFLLDRVPGGSGERLNPLFLQLARDQNRIFVFSREKISCPRHTNIFFRHFPGVWFRPAVRFFLWDNARRNPDKHYALIFFSSRCRYDRFPLPGGYDFRAFDPSRPEAETVTLTAVKKKKFE